MVLLINNSQLFDNDNLYQVLFKFKEADCILYSEDGDKFEGKVDQSLGPLERKPVATKNYTKH